MGADIGAHWGVCGQNQQAVYVFRQPQLFGRTQHAVRHLAAHFGGLDFEIAGQYRAGQGAGHFNANLHIGRAANDLQPFAGAGIHLGDVKAVGIGVFLHRFYFGHHHAAKGGGGRLGFFHFQPGHGEQMS